ncbi:N-acetylgalactosamine-6-sulfatase [Rhabdobacter roseus]|uniref:N-acetylgalactosamine-6-sulfatase n=1 Tax=Rhabdobacter roseus TaxID=1655419 RepID=A0A840TQT9_9BACT|nr:sulfatase-like hydrolase/transferase [Rhabdobacter roseus]MBB5284087.1 N-acetylgalactosamine-6-sulfatase [Rhabdobacter roseus]
MGSYKLITRYLLWVLLVGTYQVEAQPSKVPRPNVIFILADDMGWGDAGCYGNRRFKTPAIDRLAREGRLFTEFYVNGSVCSPSRAAFLTGRYPARDSIHGHLATPEANQQRGMANYLNPSLPTLPGLLRQAGYATAQIGKWHLGHSPDAPLPGSYGNEYFITNTSRDTADFDLWAPANRPRATGMVVDEALGFIEKHHPARPFYVNMWLVDPHAVLAPSEEQLREFENGASAKPYARKHYQAEIPFYGAPQVYFAAMTEMDRQIGRLIDRLVQLGVYENTILIFSSDNGPEDMAVENAAHSAAGSNGPFRGRKRSLYEGGIRVPFIVKWSGKVPAGTIDSTTVVSGVDLLPSVLRLCGVSQPSTLAIDGEDLSAAWLGKPTPRRRPLCWEWRYAIPGHVLDRSPQLAIRDQDWKLLMNPDRSRVELYHLRQDPSELRNRAAEEPKVTQRLMKYLLDWHKTLPAGPVDASVGKNDYPWPGRK